MQIGLRSCKNEFDFILCGFSFDGYYFALELYLHIDFIAYAILFEFGIWFNLNYSIGCLIF